MTSGRLVFGLGTGYAQAEHDADMRIIHSNLDPKSRMGFCAGWEAGSTNLAMLLHTHAIHDADGHLGSVSCPLR